MLRIEHLSKVYGDGTPALHDVSVTIPDGQFVAVVGPDGAGKSTFLRCITRLIEPTTGRIWFDDVEVTAASADELRGIRWRIGMWFQQQDVLAGRPAARPGARGAAPEPALLLADAPGTPGDAASTQAILEYLAALNRAGGTTVICNLPQVGLARRYADRVLVFRNGGAGGEIVFDGPPEAIDPAHLRALLGEDVIAAEIG